MVLLGRNVSIHKDWDFSLLYVESSNYLLHEKVDDMRTKNVCGQLNISVFGFGKTTAAAAHNQKD